jgi:hypothetical protein
VLFVSFLIISADSSLSFELDSRTRVPFSVSMRRKKAPSALPLMKLFRGHAHRDYAATPKSWSSSSRRISPSGQDPVSGQSRRQSVFTFSGCTSGNRNGSKTRVGVPESLKSIVLTIGSSPMSRREQLLTISPRITSCSVVYPQTQLLLNWRQQHSSRNIAIRDSR